MHQMIFGAKTETSASLLPESGSETKNSGAADKKKKKKGHGRNGTDKFPGARRIAVPGDKLKAGDPCPKCPEGKLYDTKRPAVQVRIVATPMFAAEIYEMLRRMWDFLIEKAAQAWLFWNEDTRMKVLTLMKENARYAASASPGKHRTGMFTSAILAQAGEHQIALFFTGRKHAGENLQCVLEERGQEWPPPIQMCDGSSSNQPKGVETVAANCCAHSRRK